MFGAFSLVHILYEKCDVLPCKSITFRLDWELSPLLLELVVHWWGVGTGEKNISCFWEALLRHPPRGYTQATVPERCAKRVKDLTDSIVRTYAYPVAYGGFSDVWSCQLRCGQSPPKRVRALGTMESFQRTILIVEVPQVAIKAIRPVIVNDEEFQLKKKVTSVRVQ